MRNTKKMAFSDVAEAFTEDLLSLVCLCYIHVNTPTVASVGLKHRVEPKGGNRLDSHVLKNCC